jgi:hypothetical protein
VVAVDESADMLLFVDGLNVCRCHLHQPRRLIIQRYPPGWTPIAGSTEVGPVTVGVGDIVSNHDGFSAEVTYTLDQRSWSQRFEAADVDNDELLSLATAAGFDVIDNLDDAGAWVRLTPMNA